MVRLAAAALTLLLFAVSANAQVVRWEASHLDLAERSQSVNIGNAEVVIELRHGISCTISEVSVSGGRQVRCNTGGPFLTEFSIQCTPTRLRDEKQVRFRRETEGAVDFISLECIRDERRR